MTNITAAGGHHTTLMSDLVSILCALYAFFIAPDRERPIYEYSCASILFCYWTAIIASIMAYHPTECIEIPLVWCSIQSYFRFTHHFRANSDRRLNVIIPGVLDEEREYLMADIYTISRGFNIANNIVNIQEVIINHTAALPNNFDGIALGRRNSLRQFLSSQIICGENREAIVALLAKFINE